MSSLHTFATFAQRGYHQRALGFTWPQLAEERVPSMPRALVAFVGYLSSSTTRFGLVPPLCCKAIIKRQEQYQDMLGDRTGCVLIDPVLAQAGFLVGWPDSSLGTTTLAR